MRGSGPTEADTCRDYVVPGLRSAGWEDEPHVITEQRTFTDGRIVVAGTKARRREGKRADYLLGYTKDVPVAVVEAKREFKAPATGLQQAKDYAEILDLKFAYATNGKGIVEYDYLTGEERNRDTFPTPDELWRRLEAGGEVGAEDQGTLLTPSYGHTGTRPRYYQEIAVNRVLKGISGGDRRMLLTMATGTGKTFVAFQICWKLWSSRWNARGESRRPRILYLADRNVLVDDPKDKTFTPFGEARWKIEREAVKSREMYFAIYQAIAEDERRPGLYREYDRDFFDLIVVDECHRGSAKDESRWREILEYFEPAYQLGMTATPLRDDNRTTYQYFGNPVYQYSLKQGIEDGFLAPYRVHRVVTTVDATGWRPGRGELDRFGNLIPDDDYHTKDFERTVALRSRTEAIARHLSDFMKGTDRFAKTIVFCVDQEHALEMRRALINLNTDITKEYPDYVCRVTADEGNVGRGHLSRFQELETKTPTILTTSQLLTTGVDAPTCRNVVLARNVGTMTEFKQIIGRGTRVRDDYDKLYFSILDYTGSATRLFADPDFDGDPALITEEEMDEYGKSTTAKIVETETEDEPGGTVNEPPVAPTEPGRRRKYYVDGGEVEIVAHMVHEFDSSGKQLRIVRFTDYAAEKVRTLYPTEQEMREMWIDPDGRAEIVELLEDRGIDFDELASATGQPDADPFDLLCHLAFNAPLRTRRERADRLKSDRRDFFERYGAEAQDVLEEILEKYAEYGAAQFVIPDVLKLPPLSDRGNVREIASFFGGSGQLRKAVHELQRLLYAA